MVMLNAAISMARRSVVHDIVVVDWRCILIAVSGNSVSVYPCTVGILNISLLTNLLTFLLLSYIFIIQ